MVLHNNQEITRITQLLANKTGICFENPWKLGITSCNAENGSFSLTSRLLNQKYFSIFFLERFTNNYKKISLKVYTEKRTEKKSNYGETWHRAQLSALSVVETAKLLAKT